MRGGRWLLRCSPDVPQSSKMESFVIIIAKLSLLDASRGTGYTLGLEEGVLKSLLAPSKYFFVDISETACFFFMKFHKFS